MSGIKFRIETIKSTFQLISNLSDEENVFDTCEAGISEMNELEAEIDEAIQTVFAEVQSQLREKFALENGGQS